MTMTDCFMPVSLTKTNKKYGLTSNREAKITNVTKKSPITTNKSIWCSRKTCSCFLKYLQIIRHVVISTGFFPFACDIKNLLLKTIAHSSRFKPLAKQERIGVGFSLHSSSKLINCCPFYTSLSFKENWAEWKMGRLMFKMVIHLNQM